MAKTTQEKIAVMQACVDGKEIQLGMNDVWVDAVSNPRWNWADYDYRVKVEKKSQTIFIYRNKRLGHLSLGTAINTNPDYKLVHTQTIEWEE